MSVILTFHRKMAAYESSWLIFVKALMINDITLKEFTTLIQKKQIHQPSLANLRWLDSGQFDLLALSNTLRLPRRTVQNAFLDQLVYGPLSNSPSAVRHCRECIKNFYHCTFFQFLWLAECPVHQLELKNCTECLRTFQDFKLKALKGEADWGVCKHLSPFMERQFPVHTLSEDACAMFSSWGDSLTTWFRRAMEVSAEDALSKIISSPLSYFDASNRFAYWRYLEGKVGMAPLAIPAPGYSVDKLSFTCLFAENEKDADNTLPHLVACFKSLRRHLYKKYVKPHRYCINQFKRLNVREYYALNGQTRCSCALAYYSWLITTLNLYTMEDLTGWDFTRQSPYAKGRRFDRYSKNVSVRTVLLEAWVIFHDYWAVYELHGWNDTEPADIVAQLRPARGFEHNFAHLSLHTREPETGKPRNCYFPSGGYLLSRSLARCQMRHGMSQVLTDRKLPSPSGLPNVTREIIFEVRYNHEQPNKIRYLRI